MIFLWSICDNFCLVTFLSWTVRRFTSLNENLSNSFVEFEPIETEIGLGTIKKKFNWSLYYQINIRNGSKVSKGK